jgi:hypothetical protein
MVLSKNRMIKCAFPEKLREAVEETYTEHGGHIWVDHPRTFGHSPNFYICPSNLRHLTNCNTLPFCYESILKKHELLGSISLKVEVLCSENAVIQVENE